MSLDVYLEMPGEVSPGGSGIFVREDGQTKEISRDEWGERFPGREPVVAIGQEPSRVYSANITHNLWKMADAAGIYQALWRSEEIGVTMATQLIPILEEGLCRLKSEPARFEAMNPSNGWGDYAGMVRFTQDYLAACRRWPAARVSVSR